MRPKIHWRRQKFGGRDGWMWKMPHAKVRFTIHRFNRGKKSQKVFVYMYLHDTPHHEVCLHNFKHGKGFYKTPKEAKRFVKDLVKALEGGF